MILGSTPWCEVRQSEGSSINQIELEEDDTIDLARLGPSYQQIWWRRIREHNEPKKPQIHIYKFRVGHDPLTWRGDAGLTQDFVNRSRG